MSRLNPIRATLKPPSRARAPVHASDRRLSRRTSTSEGAAALSLHDIKDQKVESALLLAWSTIPAASSVPFLTIPALVEWTPRDITKGDLVEYARRHEQGTSTEDAVRRGVVVQVVNNKGTMAKHYVFVLFSPNSAVQQCDAPFRSRFYALKRHVTDLWHVDQHVLSSKLLHRPCIEHHKTATYGPSLAFEFLGVPEPASFERPDREARAAVLCALGMVMSFGDESLLMISGRVLLKYKWEPNSNSPTEMVVRLPAHAAGIQQTS